MATRLALGTTRGRLLQQTITESLLLSIAGGLAGVVLARWALGAIDVFALNALPRRGEIALDAQVLGYTFVLVTLVAIIVGLWPTVSLRSANVARIIGEEGRFSTSTRRARAARQLLITSQVAFALILLMGAGLLLASFQRVLAVDLGFRTDRVLTGDITLGPPRYRGPAVVRAAQDRILAELRTLPGISTVGLTTSIPFGNDFTASLILAEGYAQAPGESLIAPSRVSVSDGYFEAMGVHLVAGRFIDARDVETAPRAIVIDEPLAQKFWPNANPIGRRMYFPSKSLGDIASPPPEDEWLTVVGLVKPMRLQGIVSNGGYGVFGTYFISYRQFPERHVTLALRTQQDPPTVIRAVRAAIARIDPDLAFYDVRPMEVLVDRARVDRRTTMLLAIAFAVVALLLCGIGVSGVLAYDVRQRTREIAIRMAVGADGPAIVGMVVRQGATVVAAGSVIGFTAAFLLRRTVQSQLYDVGAMDPKVMTAVAAVMFMVAMVACILPARRAASTNPTNALADQ
jgi:putative ABC transport system permease protein